MSDEEYEYDYGSDNDYDYGSDQGENAEGQDGNDDLIEIENSFYGTFLDTILCEFCKFFLTKREMI